MKNVFIQTLTHYYTGTLVEETPDEYRINNASWVSDTGMFSHAVKTESYDEIEVFPAAKVVRIQKRNVIASWDVDSVPTETR